MDDAVGGIIVYYPVFGSNQVFPFRTFPLSPPPLARLRRSALMNLKDSYLQQITCASKDVEGLSHAYLFNMYQNIRYLDDVKQQKSILPCTPLAIIKILEHVSVYNPVIPYGNRLFGKTITVVNRSEIVGRPLAALLANDGASVYSADIAGVQHFTRGEGIRRRRHQVHDTTLRLEDVVPRSDVVITGVPNKNYKFPVELLKEYILLPRPSLSSGRYADEELGAPCALISRRKRFARSLHVLISRVIGRLTTWGGLVEL